MAKRKIWSVGEEILATDITNNFKFGGDGSDGKIGRAHV